MNKEKISDIVVDKFLDLLMVFIGVFAGLLVSDWYEDHKSYKSYHLKMGEIYHAISSHVESDAYKEGGKLIDELIKLTKENLEERSLADQITRHESIIKKLRTSHYFLSDMLLSYQHLRRSGLLYKEMNLSKEEKLLKESVGIILDLAFPKYEASREEYERNAFDVLKHFRARGFIRVQKDGKYKVIASPREFHELEGGYYSLRSSLLKDQVFRELVDKAFSSMKPNGDKLYPQLNIVDEKIKFSDSDLEKNKENLFKKSERVRKIPTH